MENNETKTREAFRKAVWPATHPQAKYHIELLKKDSFGIGRVMAALRYGLDDYNVAFSDFYTNDGRGAIYLVSRDGDEKIIWQLLKEDGSEATDSDQTIDTIQKLLNLLKS